VILTLSSLMSYSSVAATPDEDDEDAGGALNADVDAAIGDVLPFFEGVLGILAIDGQPSKKSSWCCLC
jgi:hypothetical protein